MLRLFALIAGLCLATASFAQDFPAPVSDTVNDFAVILSPDQRATLSASLQDLRNRTKTHVVVVTMSSMADYGGPTGGVNATDAEILTFAKNLFNTWGIGDATRNDGILILLLTGDRATRIALGSGYDAVWDNPAQRIINQTMLPAFAEGNFAQGLIAAVPEVEAQIITPFQAGNPPPAPPEDSGWAWETIFGLLPAVLIVGFVFLFKSVIGVVKMMQRCESCGQRGVTVTSHVISGGTDTMDGQGVTTYLCPHCGHSRDVPYTISRTASTSHSSHDSGFGGGGSSGGGASGRF